jgi:hypothetical protein
MKLKTCGSQKRVKHEKKRKLYFKSKNSPDPAVKPSFYNLLSSFETKNEQTFSDFGGIEIAVVFNATKSYIMRTRVVYKEGRE